MQDAKNSVLGGKMHFIMLVKKHWFKKIVDFEFWGLNAVCTLKSWIFTHYYHFYDKYFFTVKGQILCLTLHTVIFAFYRI